MIRPVAIATAARDLDLGEVAAPLPLDELAAGDGAWEVEIGFGKGRFLLAEAAAHPERRFLGVEIAAEYFRLLVRRARRRGLANLVALHGEALYLLSAVLPRRFAAAVHVYFPDPWPKSRHHKRRLFDAETVDLVLGLLAPGGRLYFATDHLDYGARVVEILAAVPGLAVLRREEGWVEGPRTHYEAKYLAGGRPILRLEAGFSARQAGPAPFHPAAAPGVLVAPRGVPEAGAAPPPAEPP